MSEVIDSYIEDQDRWILEQRPHRHQAVPLAAGEFDAPIADFGVASPCP